MGTIILPAFAGLLLGIASSGARKLARIRRLKNELEIAKEQRAAANFDRLQQLEQFEDEREKHRDTRRNLILWETFAEKVAAHPMPFVCVKSTIPEKAGELLKFYEKNYVKK